MSGDRIVRLDDAALQLGVTKQGIRNWKKAGKIKFFFVPGNRRATGILQSEVDRFLREGSDGKELVI